MGKIIVLYYSSNGKTAELAKHVRSGILEEGNNEPLLRTVASLNKNQVSPRRPHYLKRELKTVTVSRLAAHPFRHHGGRPEIF